MINSLRCRGCDRGILGSSSVVSLPEFEEDMLCDECYFTSIAAAAELDSDFNGDDITDLQEYCDHDK